MKNILFILALAAIVRLHAGAAPFRPAPEKGRGAKTLVVFSETHAPYSLLNGLELVKLQLGRIDTSIEALSILQTTPEKLRECDYLVLLSLDPRSSLSTNLLAAVTSVTNPVLWVGPGINSISNVTALRGQFELNASSETAFGQAIRYRGKEWPVGAFSFKEGRLLPKSTAQLVVGVADGKKSSSHGTPLCWRFNQFTFFAAQPQNGALGFVFEDVLLDFFGVKEIPTNSVLLRLTGYNLQSDHRQFRRIADYLYSESIPFAVSVRLLTSQMSSPEANAEFLAALRYGQQRGGRIILQGAEAAAGEAEFWDQRSDRPRMQMPPGGLRRSITSVTEAALTAGLLPVAWETPQYAASSYAYGEIASIFGTAVERVQLSDATSRHNYAPAGLTIDSRERLLVPENLGFMTTTSNTLAAVQARADMLSNLRGTILGSSFDSYLPFSQLIQLVEMLKKYHVPFIDLTDLNNRVVLPDKVLLTGNGVASVTLQNATLHWRTFNRSGQLLAEDEQRTKVSGTREFKRIGIGVYEVVQFTREGER